MHKSKDYGHEPKKIVKPGPPAWDEGAAGGKVPPALRPRMSESQSELLRGAQLKVLSPDPRFADDGAGALRRGFEPMDTSQAGALDSLLPLEHLEVLHLHAVICIERSHYVTFLRLDHTNPCSKWLFFDSMADRIGILSYRVLLSTNYEFESASKLQCITTEFSFHFRFYF